MTSSDGGDDRAALEGELGEILGFHDVSDVFDHLTQFTDATDLMGYLSDLLGQQTANTDRVRGFADNLARFGRGEPIVVAAAGDGAKDRKEKSTAASAAAAVVEVGEKKAPPSKKVGTGGTGSAADGKAVGKKQSQKGKAEDDGKPPEELAKKKNAASATGKKTPPRQKTPPRKAAQKQKQPQQQQRSKAKEQPTSSSSTAASSTAKSEAAVVTKGTPIKEKPRPPPRGKATVVCGCWGTVHECLTNCLHCGRIACAEEGYGYCAFCGFLIEEVTPPPGGDAGSGKVDSATLHKERLLKFDREFARRTIVLDDQEDYYDSGGAASSSWLDEDERRLAELADDDARREKHERKAPKLNIAF